MGSEGEIASVGSTLTKLAGEGKRKCRTDQNLLIHCGVGPGGGEEEVAGPAVRGHKVQLRPWCYRNRGSSLASCRKECKPEPI